jgi:hypothetical protein
MVLPELTQVAVVQLRSDPELIGNAGGHIEPEVGEGAAALTGVHGQPIVGVGEDKPLRRESVYFHFAAKESEVLRLQGEWTCAETGNDQSDDSPMHTVSLMTCQGLHRPDKTGT